MSAFAQDLASASRALRKSPGLVGVAIATLALGVGASTAIFSVVHGAILEPWPYTAEDRFVTLRRTFSGLSQNQFVPFSAPEVLDVQARTDLFERTLAGDARDVNLTENGRPERVHGGALTASAFALLGVAPQIGRVYTSAEDVPGGPRVVVLSYRLWQDRYAADPAIVGKSIEVEGERYSVLGVMPRRFVFWGALLYFPLRLDRAATDRQARHLVIEARLAPGVTPERAASALDGLARRWEREYGSDVPEYAGSHFGVKLMKREVLRDVEPALFALAAAAGLALLVAAVNVANLLLARSTARDHEIAVRQSLGAGRARIVHLFLLDGMLIAVPGGALGLALAAAATPALLSLIPYGYIPAEANVRTDATVALYAAAVAAACGILLGLTPLLRWSGSDPARALREGSSRSAGDRRGRRARSVFVVAQIAVAMVVLSGSCLLLESMRRLLGVPGGFAAEGVQTVQVALPAGPDSARAGIFLSEMLRRIAPLPGVAACGAVTDLPLTGSPSRRVDLEGLSGASAGVSFEADLLAATPGYFSAMHIPIENGRSFSAGDVAGSPLVAVVSRRFAERFFAGRSTVGRRVRWAASHPGSWRTIVGVAGDVRQDDLEREPRPALYVPVAQAEPTPPTVALAVRSSASAEAIQAGIRSVIADLDPSLPVYAPEPLTKVVSDSLGGRRLAALLMSAFAALSLGLTALGTTALAAYSVSQRRREIAVRLALGARTPDVTRLVIRETAIRLAWGLAAGAALSLALTRMLSALLYDVSAGDPAVLAGAALLLSAITLAGTTLPARRAARIRPMEVLRSE